MFRKWIFRFNGEASNAHGMALLSVLESYSIEILANDMPRLLLVRGSDEVIASVKGQIDSRWTIAPENSSYPTPDTKRKLT